MTKRIILIFFFQIERVLSRGEKIDLLVERTENLETQSFHFKKQSNRLYWAIIVKNIKLIIIFGIIALVRFLSSQLPIVQIN